MQFLVYILVYPFLWLISILPFKLLYLFSDFLYVIVYYIVGYRKKVVYENLKLVFPEKREIEIKRISNKFYHHFCDLIVESIKSLTISEAEMKKRFKFTNVELIRELEKKQRNTILMCAHYGNFEWIFILQTYIKSKGYGVYKPLANKYFDALIKRKRAKYNSYLISTKEAIPSLIRAKRNNELTISGFVADQSPRLDKAFYWNEFMGVNTPVHTGAEMLAKKLDMPVVFFAVNKIKRGYYETTFETITTTPKDYKNYEITNKYLKLVEAQIYKAPEFYFWTHKRWKHRKKQH
ncbi:lysophospholipid acyltransferase family protein [uncultured Algibacter sp.]|uniref:lysophospholipid acyltransferase family protein n=1 Tax=uncultured Algibacter sp. TaxID=298659 RepID=UPI0026061500|nr:lysophospholipid acyltransferase family protein [uncultured Algibacter sp.]